MPVTVGQILWVNMVTAVTLALALAFEPAEPGVMQQPPRAPKEALVTRPLALRVAYVSFLMALITLVAFEWELSRGSSIEGARTTAVNVLVVGEMLYLFNVRHSPSQPSTSRRSPATASQWSSPACWSRCSWRSPTRRPAAGLRQRGARVGVLGGDRRPRRRQVPRGRGGEGVLAAPRRTAPVARAAPGGRYVTRRTVRPRGHAKVEGARRTKARTVGARAFVGAESR